MRRGWSSIVWVACLAFVTSGCSVRSYGIGRGIRYVTGASTHVHVVVPVDSTLKRYHAVEARHFENLVGTRLPPDLEHYLNDQWVRRLQALPVPVAAAQVDLEREGDAGAPARSPTLLCGGFVDDYDPGYPWLRLAELGFNHLVVTVRIQCRDERTHRVLGAASVTVRDGRVTATGRAAIDRVVRQAEKWLRTGFAP